MSSLKPIKLWSHAKGPNPWKIAIICKELNVPYENQFLEDGKIKEEPFISINPNGRVPAIEDPNTGYTIWESGAIIKYMVDEYDKDHKISYATKPELYHTDEWLFFQVSGQGPYFGQFAWFSFLHPEKLPSAIERYANEIKRIIGVIDTHLTKHNQQWLVGDKCTYADLSFVPWNQIIGAMNIDVYEDGKKNQGFKAWFDRLMEKESVKAMFAEKEEATAKK